MTCQDLGHELGVERAGHLVEEQQVGLHRERPDDRDPLLLAAGEPIGVLGGLVGESEASRAAPSASASASAGRELQRPCAGASVTLSRTRMCGKRLKAWKTIPISAPDPVDVSTAAVMSSPSMEIRPASIGSRRLMHRSSVDLPDPDAPIRQTTSCSRDLQVDPPQHLEAPERLAQPLEERKVAAADRLDAHRAAASRRLRSRATSQSVSRASGIVMTRKTSAVARYGVKLKIAGLLDLRLAEDLDDADVARRATVSFWRPMKSLRSGGITRRTACGRTT